MKSSKGRDCIASLGSLFQHWPPLEAISFWGWTSPAPSASALQQVTILVALHWIHCSLSMSFFYYRPQKWMQIWANKCWGEEDNDFSQSPGCIIQSGGLVGLAAARRHCWPLQIPVPIWLHAAFSVEQLSSFCGCKGLFFSRHWTLHFSLLNFSCSSSLSRSLLMTAWLSIILTALPMLDVTCIFDKQTRLQVTDKDVKCDWTQVLQLLPTTR